MMAESAVCPEHGPMRLAWVHGADKYPETTGDLWVCPTDEDCDYDPEDDE